MRADTEPLTPRRGWVPRLLLAASLLAACGSCGCAALTNPVADAVPVRWIPEEVLGRPKAELQPLPLTLLRRKEPDAYRVDAGDVLGVYAEDVLDPRGQPIPVQVNPNPLAPVPVAQGHPIRVQDDGTIVLPHAPPIPVRGMTLKEVRERIVKAITVDAKLVVPGKERVLVDLIQPRRYRVLVVREDAQSAPLLTSGAGFAGVIGGERRGQGTTLYLEAYQNDLLEALNRTGGPPGLDAKNEVVIRRGEYDPADPAKGFVRVPLRVRPDEPVALSEEDITLRDGDTVYIEARGTEVYYAAGLVGPAQFPLPRDYDLRVVEAIAQLRGPLVNGSFNQNAFVANAVNAGIGNPNASLVTVVRHLPNGRTVPIRVDLNRAFRDQRENILVLPGDYLVLQERPNEAIARYFTQTFRLTTTLLTFRGRDFAQAGVFNNP